MLLIVIAFFYIKNTVLANPDWGKIDSSINNSLTFTFVIEVNDAMPKLGDDIVGVFVGDSLRGEGKILGINDGKAFSSITTRYKNVGETFTFKFYDSEIDKIYNSNKNYTITSKDVSESSVGSFSKPYSLAFKDKKNALIKISDLNQVYDGTPKKPNIGLDPDGLNFKLTYKNTNGEESAIAPIDAGKYELYVTVIDEIYESYQKATFVISRANPNVTVNSRQLIQYDINGGGKYVEFDVKKLLSNDLKVLYKHKDENAVKYSSALPITAGTYDVKAIVDSQNYYSENFQVLTIKNLPNDWVFEKFSVVPKTIWANIYLDSLSPDFADLLGVFVNGKLRGLQQLNLPIYDDKNWAGFEVMYDPNVSTEELVFKLLDHDTGKILVSDLEISMDNNSNKDISTFLNPLEIKFANIVKDIVSPDISLLGKVNIILEAGNIFSDSGAIANDNIDGDVTSKIKVTGKVDSAKPGVYELYYNVKDSKGNAATQVVRRVEVVDTTGPVIVLKGSSEIVLEAGSEYKDQGASGADIVDGEVAVKTSGKVQTNKPGEYVVTYTAVDKAGNKAEELVRKIRVVDTTGPVITLKGKESLSHEAGTAYSDKGASAIDIVDGDLSGLIKVSGRVNVNRKGNYILSYGVADGAGNNAEKVERVVSVEDTRGPVITLSGDSEIRHEAGVVYEDLGASASDLFDGQVEVKMEGEVFVDELGEYEISYTAVDTSGNKSEAVTRTVRVVDTIRPEIVLKGSDSVMHEAGTAYVDLGVVASDDLEGDLTESVKVSGKVDSNKLGEYKLRYNVSDGSGNRAKLVERVVRVVDTMGPVIVLKGEDEIRHEAGGEYKDLGASGADIVDGEVVVKTSGEVQSNKPGEYVLTYTAIDKAGNKAEELVRKIRVVDTTGPVISLKGKESLSHEAGTVYSDKGAIANDVVDGDLSGLIKVSGTVNVNRKGDYTLSYGVADAAGNNAKKVERVVSVLDTRGPVVTLSGNPEVIHEAGVTYDDLGASASDLFDGEVEVKMEGDVLVDQLGEYEISYNAVDTSGNKAETVNRTVRVVDTNAPVITLLGQAVINIEVGQAYTDLGANAKDGLDGDVTNLIKVSGTVNTKRVGEYQLRYDVSDNTGNEAQQLIRTIVVGDTGRPVITLNGKAVEVFESGGVYEEAGATAKDTGDGDVTSKIKVTGKVDSAKPGVYELYYNVKDSKGNAATQVVRRVEVVDTTGPVIVLKGSSEIVLEAGSEYKDQGASGADIVDGEVAVKTSGKVQTNKPGEYVVTYTAVDKAGNKAISKERKVLIVDTTGPTIELNGQINIIHEGGVLYTDAGATSYDIVDGNLTGSIQVVNNIDLNEPGDYYIRYSVKDRMGNNSLISRLVTVVDTIAPKIKLNNGLNIDHEYGEIFKDPGATAFDQVDGNISSRITASGIVNINKIGKYEIEYEVEDKSKNKSIKLIRIVNIVDTTPPKITLLGEEFINIEAGDDYTDSGATAYDNVDGNITFNIISSKVNLGNVGINKIVYSVSDLSGNNANNKTRTVTVTDTTPPTIKLYGQERVYHEAGINYVDNGAYAEDIVDGFIDINQFSIDSNININAPGIYTIKYNVADKNGNEANEVKRIIEVNDTTGPLIRLNGDSTVLVEGGGFYKEEGAVAEDSLDGLVGIKIVGEVNINKLGTQILTYSAEDKSGNKSISIKRLIVVQDTIGPSLLLKGQSVLNLELGSNYEEIGYEATDIIDGDLMDKVIVEGTVNPSIKGEYTLKYKVEDLSGNISNEATRTIIVGDSKRPIIKLNGLKEIKLEYGSIFKDPGVIATDSGDGDISNYVQVTGSVDSKKIGSYVIKYNVTDNSGNQAIEVFRTIYILDNKPPELNLIGNQIITLEAGSKFIEPGAKASDTVAGLLQVNINGFVNNKVPGDYTISYSAVDQSGNTAQLKRVVRVIDSTAPTISLNGKTKVFHEAGTHYIDLGAIVYDNVDKNLEPIVDNVVNINTLGSNIIKYNAIDLSGNKASEIQRIVEVKDTVAPKINIVGDSTIIHEAGIEYQDLGANGIDLFDDSVTIKKEGVVNINKIGEYKLKYQAIDKAGNKSNFSERTVKVKDSTPPTINLLGPNIVTHELGDKYKDLGATAIDIFDGNLTDQIQVNITNLDIFKLGSYSITYQVKDNSNNESKIIERYIRVIDTKSPIIQIIGESIIRIEEGTLYEEPGVIAFDNIGDISVDLTEFISVSGEVNANLIGTYILKYDVLDNSGNKSNEISRNIIVEPAKIVIIGQPESIQVKEGENAHFDIEVSGTLPINYQWYKDGNLINGAIQNALIVNNASTSINNSQYEVQVSNQAGIIRSSSARLLVASPPTNLSVFQSPKLAISGKPLKLKANVSGTKPLRYEWRLNNELIIEYNGLDEIYFNPITSSQKGEWLVKVSNAAGEVELEYNLDVIDPIKIIDSPVNSSVISGGNAEFRVKADGTNPKFQWMFNGENLINQNKDILELSNVTVNDIGLYQVLIFNESNSILTEEVQLKVSSPPEIIDGIQLIDSYGYNESNLLTVGHEGKIYARITGTKPLSVQWYKNNQLYENIYTDNETSIALNKIINKADNGIWKIVVRNNAGIDEAELQINTRKEVGIIKQPTSLSILEGSDAVFEILTTGTNKKFRWTYNDDIISNENSSELKIENANKGNVGKYRVFVENEFSSLFSDEVRLDVSFPPLITDGKISILDKSDYTQDSRLTEGFYGEISASFTGTPPLNVEWYQDGKLKNISQSDKNGSKISKIIDIEDAGKWKLVVTNNVGSNEVEYDVIVRSPVKIINSPRDTAVIVGNTTKLEVEAVGDDLKFQWKYNGVDIPNEIARNINIEGSLNNVGNYSVLVKNTFSSSLSESALLDVSYPPTIRGNSINIIDKFDYEENTRLTEGQLGEIFVKYDGTPPLQIEWFHNENKVKSSEDTRDGSYIRKLISSEDSGFWRVRVTNDSGSVEAQLENLIVRQPVKIIKQPNSISANEGSEVKLNVISQGNNLNYQWKFNGKNIDNETDSNLIIKNIKSENIGKYIVVISNDFSSTASKEVSIDLSYLPKIKSIKVIDSDLSNISNNQLTAGINGKILAEVTGSEPMIFSWFKNGEEVVDNNDNMALDKTITKLDEGNWKLVVENNAGQAESEVFVEVREPIKILNTTNSLYARPGEKIKLEISAIGSNKEYQWKLNGVNIDNTNSSKIEIENVNEKSYGEYQVVVNNEFSKALSPVIRISKAYPVSVESFTQGPINVREGLEDVTLNLIVSGTPPFTYNWYKYEDELDNNPILINKKSISSNRDTYIIPAAQRTDSGFYKAIISNKYGGEISTILTEINVLYPPKVGEIIAKFGNTIITESNEIIQGADLELTINVDDINGEVEYQWLKNGVILKGELKDNLILNNTIVQDSGNYSVMVKSKANDINSKSFNLKIQSGKINLSDNYENANYILGLNNILRGNNVDATFQDFEPRHANITSRNSVWAKYIPDSDGALEINTNGSSFDTTLAVYTGNRINDLQIVSGGSDRNSGEYLNSKVKINVKSNITYHIAIDGFGSPSTGDIILDYTFTPDIELPEIIIQPKDIDLRFGENGKMIAEVNTQNMWNLNYEWYKQVNESWILINKSNSPELTFDVASLNDIGSYKFIIKNNDGEFLIESKVANLYVRETESNFNPINFDPAFVGSDDTGNSEIGKPFNTKLTVGTPKRSIIKLDNEGNELYSSIVYWNNSNSNKSPGEPSHAGESGGASMWTIFKSDHNGSAKIRTEGDSFNTVISVYTINFEYYDESNVWSVFEELTSDNNSSNKGYSEIIFPVSKNIDYYIAIDGAGGAKGNIKVVTEFSSTPVIRNISQDISSIEGESFKLNVNAGNEFYNAPLSYQWQKDGVILSGEVNNELIIKDATNDDFGIYSVTVNNFAGSTIGPNINVTSYKEPIIIQDPTGGIYNSGEGITLSVLATGSTLNYEWYLNGNILQDCKTNEYVIKKLSIIDEGTYYCKVFNKKKHVYSKSININISQPPQIIDITESNNYQSGELVKLKVNASGDKPLSYQWSKNNVPIDGATDKVYIIEELNSTYAGNYYVTIKNDAGEITNKTPIGIDIIYPVEIISQPKSTRILYGDSGKLSVLAIGTDVNYTWYFNGFIIPGENENTLHIDKMGIENIGDYKVIINNPISSVSSQISNITISTPPRITSISENKFIEVGSNVALQVNATGDMPIMYQWLKNNVDIINSNKNNLLINNFSKKDIGDYSVSLINNAGSILSENIRLDILRPIEIISQPNSIIVPEDNSINFKILANGTNIKYSWYLNNRLINGINNDTFEIKSIGLSDEGEYKVLVENDISSKYSEPFTLSIAQLPKILKISQGGYYSEGEKVSLTVDVESNTIESYQWYKNNVILSNANTENLIIDNFMPSDAGNYKVKINNSAGTLTSDDIYIDNYIKIDIVKEPSNNVLLIGENAEFNVIVSGTNPTYSWFKNDKLLPNQKERILKLEDVSTEDEGIYYVIASNETSSYTSNTSSLIIGKPPVIETISKDQFVLQGDDILLSATVKGQGLTTYQWSLDNVMIKKAKTLNYNITNITESDTGNYQFTASNKFGNTSKNISVEIIREAIINVDLLKEYNTTLGDDLELNVVSSGSHLKYKWYKNNELLLGENTNKLIITNFALNDVGVYYAEVSNPISSVESIKSIVRIALPPVITDIDDDIDVELGQNTTITASIIGDKPMSFQWKKDGVNINSNNNTLLISNISSEDVGNYSILASNDYGIVESKTVSVRLYEPATIINTTKNLNLNSGQNLTLNVDAIGSKPLYFQWYFNNSIIPNSLNPILKIDNINRNNFGEYKVSVRNNSSSDYSDPIIISENKKPVINIIGNDNIEISIGEEFIEPGYKGIDAEDGDITNLVRIEGDIIDTSKSGIYTVTYTLNDSNGISALKRTRIIKVVDKPDENFTPLVIMISSDSKIIRFNSIINYNYIVERSIDLLNWNLKEALIGTGNELIINNININNEKSFYRIRIEKK